MTDDVVALVKEKLEADAVLSTLGPKNGPIRVIIAGARLAKNPARPYIVVDMIGGEEYASMGKFGLELTIHADDSATRWRIQKRVHHTLHEKRLAKPGMNILRMCQVNATDNLPDRQSGMVKLGVLYKASAVLTDKLYDVT
jgi:hypothetical protein